MFFFVSPIKGSLPQQDSEVFTQGLDHQPNVRFTAYGTDVPNAPRSDFAFRRTDRLLSTHVFTTSVPEVATCR